METAKKRGRPELENKSIMVSWRIPHDVYQLLEIEQEKQEKTFGHKPALSKVFQGIVKKYTEKQ